MRLGCLAMGLVSRGSGRSLRLSLLSFRHWESAIHRPMGTYSSGMGARLRFAIALAARPKILLIDEALSTGDATFAESSERAMDELLAEAGTVLLVNHAAKVIQELCTRAVWMHRGEILMNGPAEAVAEKYRWWAWNVAKGKEDIADKLLADVMSNAVKEEINILEPELIKNPIPRHAARPSKKKAARARHVKRQDTVEEVEETPTPMLAAAEEQVWPKSFDAEMPKAKFPALPKPGLSGSERPTNHRCPSVCGSIPVRNASFCGQRTRMTVRRRLPLRMTSPAGGSLLARERSPMSGMRSGSVCGRKMKLLPFTRIRADEDRNLRFLREP